MGARTVTVQRSVGLGDMLLSTCASWRYARDTCRTLVIDWRRSLYAPRDQNLFTLLFEETSEWLGVPVHIAQPDEASPDPEPTEIEDESAAGEAACALVEKGVDLDRRHVVWRGCLAPTHPPQREMAALLSALSPLPDRADALASARRQLLGTGPSIGVHLRHGNGGNILNHTHWWDDGLAVHRVVETIREARAVIGADAPVVVCTDSREVLDAMTSLVPGVRAVEKRWRSPGDGDLHLWAGAAESLSETFVEMFLLAHTTVLIRMPPRSYFSAPAAFIKQPAPRELLHREPPMPSPGVW